MEKAPKLYLCSLDTPIGRVALNSRGDKLEYVHMPGGALDFLSTSDINKNVHNEDFPQFLLDIRDAIDAYFSKDFEAIPNLDIKYNTSNSKSKQLISDEVWGTKKRMHTDFQKDVWNATTEIPIGEVSTYKGIAERINRPKAARPIGYALSGNPCPILFPCHRVINSNGKLGGYMGYEDYVWIKEWLLKHEGTI